jgi:hypothetical protein
MVITFSSNSHFSFLQFLINNLITAFTQDIRNQEETRQEDEAKQTHPWLDSPQNWKQN